MNENVVIIRQTHTHSLVSMMTISLSLSHSVYFPFFIENVTNQKIAIETLNRFILFFFLKSKSNRTKCVHYISMLKQTNKDRERERVKKNENVMSCHVICVCVCVHISFIDNDRTRDFSK